MKFPENQQYPNQKQEKTPVIEEEDIENYTALTQAIEMAGSYVHEVWKTASQNQLVIEDLANATKLDVTEYDHKVEDLLVSAIKGFGRECEIYSEENFDQIPDHGKSVWIIDPISGTRLFKNGKENYAVVVSHMKDGVVVYTAVYIPTSQEMFTATKGRGAFVHRPNQVRDDGTYTPQQLKVDTDLNLPIIYEYSSQIFDRITPVHKPQYGEDLYRELCKETPGKVLRTVGSMAYHYALVASGKARGAITMNKDTYPEMAGKLLVEEAGGVCADLSGKDINIHSIGGVIFAADRDIKTKYTRLCFPFLEYRKTNKFYDKLP